MFKELVCTVIIIICIFITAICLKHNGLFGGTTTQIDTVWVTQTITFPPETVRVHIGTPLPPETLIVQQIDTMQCDTLRRFAQYLATPFETIRDDSVLYQRLRVDPVKKTITDSLFIRPIKIQVPEVTTVIMEGLDWKEAGLVALAGVIIGLLL